MALTIFNFYAGSSGLQPIESVFWLSYNLLLTVWQMGWTFLLDQDAPMIHSAKIVQRRSNSPKPIEHSSEQQQSPSDQKEKQE